MTKTMTHRNYTTIGYQLAYAKALDGEKLTKSRLALRLNINPSRLSPSKRDEVVPCSAFYTMLERGLIEQDKAGKLSLARPFSHVSDTIINTLTVN